MANPWFRLYSEFAHDPKVQRLSEVNQRRYIMLLCIRCSNGNVTLHDSDISFQLRISDAEWIDTKNTLIERNLIDNDNKPAAWDKRQYSSDSSIERVARHRANKKQQCNSDVTLLKQQSNFTDTDTDTDTEKSRDRAETVKVDDTFDQFWKAYPKKTGKAEALKSWKKHKPELNAVLSALSWQTKSQAWNKDGGQYIPNPATYLNQGRWQDEPAGGSVSGGSGMDNFLRKIGAIPE